jgi:hypothetical protein
MTETVRAPVQCPTCKSKLFDGKVIKGVSVISILPDGRAEGLCKRSKTWVELPIFYGAKSPVVPFDEAV